MNYLAQATIFITPAHLDQKTRITEWLSSLLPETTPLQYMYSNEELESISVDLIRTLKKDIQYAVDATQPRYTILLASEKMSITAQNALLKTLEEPPPNNYLVLVTSDPNLLLPTIQSRCQLIFDTYETPDDENTMAVESIIKTITTSTHGELISLADTYTTRDDVLALLRSISKHIYKSITLTSKSSLNDNNDINLHNKSAKMITFLIHYIRLLEKNVHVKLALTECFFELKVLLPNNTR